MRLIWILVFTISIWITFGTCDPLNSNNNYNIETWEQFKEYFNKKYSSLEEESERKINFENALKFVRENQGRNSVELGINEFSDLSDSEFFAKNSLLSQANQSKLFNSIAVDEDSLEYEYDLLPNHFDWREHIRFNPVEHQGSCGSCWAFASVLTVEAAYAIHHRTQVHLSKQELVDCSMRSYNAHYINQGCNLGYTTEAFKYMKEHGVYEEAFYPYKASNQLCYLSKLQPHSRFRITDFQRLVYNCTDVAIMNVVRTQGPIVVNINDGDPIFKHYKSGIIRNLMPNIVHTTHSVTLIGWGRYQSTDYWIIRNSWGANWGEAGHVRIERHKNLMGVNNHPVYPILR